MRNSLRRKLFIFGFPVISAALIAASFLTRDDNFDTRSSASEGPVAISETEGVPKVVSVNPTVAQVGEPFTYYLRVVDSDDELSALTFTVVDAPEWMTFNKDDLVIYGIPEIYDTDTQKIVIEVSDGDHTIEYKFYLLVLDEDGEDS